MRIRRKNPPKSARFCAGNECQIISAYCFREPDKTKIYLRIGEMSDILLFLCKSFKLWQS